MKFFQVIALIGLFAANISYGSQLVIFKQELSKDISHLSVEEQHKHWITLHQALKQYQKKNDAKIDKAVICALFAWGWYQVAQLINPGGVAWKDVTLSYISACSTCLLCWCKSLENGLSSIDYVVQNSEDTSQLEQMLVIARSRAQLH